MMAGLIEPDEGHVSFKGEKLKNPSDMLIPGHESIAYLSQHFELPKFKTVFEHLDDPYLNDSEDAGKVYDACQISNLLNRDTRELSGGEKQRVALANLLLRSPEVLLLDEPFSNLDFNHKRIIRSVLDVVERELGTTIALVVHDPKDVLSWAERVLVLRSGEIVQEGKGEDIYERPASTYVAGLFGTYSYVTADLWKVDSARFTVVDGKAIVRPEHFEISSVGVPGEVKSLSYYGGYDEVMVSTKSDEITILSKPNEHQVGQGLTLRLKP